MTNTTNLIAKLAVAIGLTGSLALAAATPSLARSHTAPASAGSEYYEPGDNGSNWSYYPGYTDRQDGPAARRTHGGAYAQAPGFNRLNAPVDNPPGSAFQDEGNREESGFPAH
jgi:hypothetical protein